MTECETCGCGSEHKPEAEKCKGCGKSSDKCECKHKCEHKCE